MLYSWILGGLTIGPIILIYLWGEREKNSGSPVNGATNVSELPTLERAGVATVAEHTETVP